MSGSELFIEVFTCKLFFEASFVIGMDLVFHRKRESFEEVASGFFDFKSVTVMVVLEFDVVVSLNVEVIDGGIVSGKSAGDGCEGVCLVAAVHSGLNIVDTDYDLVRLIVAER